MFSSQARIPTDRATRYLAQLGKHTGQLGRLPLHRMQRHGHGAAQPDVAHGEWSDTEGVIAFGQGRCTLRATDDALILRAEAADTAQLLRIQEGVARRLEGIGRRDRLTVSWGPTTPDTETADEG